MPTLIRPRQRTTSTSSVDTIRPSRAVVMLDELTRTYQDLDVGSEIDPATGSSSDLVEGSNSRSATPVGVRKIPAPTAKVVKPPTTTVSTSTKATSARKSSNRISKHSSTKLQERKGKSTFGSLSSSSSSSIQFSSPSLAFPPNISTPSPSHLSSTPILHSSAQAELESGSSSSSMVTNRSPTPPGPPSPHRKLTPTLGALSLRPTSPSSTQPGLLSGESTSVNLTVLPPNPPEIHPSQEENPFPSRSVPRNASRMNDPDQRQGSFHSPFAFDGPPFEYQEYGDFSSGYSGASDQQEVGDGLTVRIFDEEHSTDPFRSGLAPPEIFVEGVGVEEWEKEQEQAILRAPIALQSLQLRPFSDESSASSDDPFEFDARRRPWIPTRTSPSGVARQTKVHRKVQAEDLKLDVVFSRSRHQVFWDMDDQEYLICPAQIHVLLKHPLQWNQLSGDISMPEIYALDLACNNDAVPSILAKRDPDHDFSVRYTGSRATSESESRRPSRKKKSTRRPGSTPPTMVPKRGICIDFDWEKLYSPSGSWEDSGSYSNDGRYMKGWFTDIWIPIPTRLFAKKETRTFTISSEIWFHRDANATHGGSGRGGRGGSGSGGRSKKRDVDEELEPDGVFGSEKIMTVSHLWKEREMFKLW
ncbi:hypothetical protein BDN72DRAFT_841325 [Pluteus cervinus]|uniref:Uncharacterized protein n=1 Tax=Pluteus cervinus TaxID=181527 RepID=A0ACD3AT17_9AGAR|nr:hypothetical protein BDN72DRAFT_841325 [Pluteus cervinus]